MNSRNTDRQMYQNFYNKDQEKVDQENNIDQSIFSPWGFLIPSKNNNKKIELVNQISFINLREGNIEILSEDYLNYLDGQIRGAKPKNFRQSVRIIQSESQKEVLIQCMDEMIELSLFNKKVKLGEIKQIFEGDILSLKSIHNQKPVEISLIFSLNKNGPNQKQKESSSEDIKEEVLKLKGRINEIKQLDENLEHDLNCSICLEIMHNPVTIINCLHNFCSDCLSKAVIINNVINFICPTCRQPINELKPNLLLKSVIEKHFKVYPELKKDLAYYQAKDRENNNLKITEWINLHNQLQQIKVQQNYRILRDHDDEGVRLCSQFCSFIMMILFYCTIQFISKKFENSAK